MVKSHPKWECFLHWAYPVYHFACLNHVKSHQYPSFDAKKIPFTPHFSCWNSIFWSWIFPLLRSPGLQKRPVTGFTILHRLRVCILQALQLFLQLRRASRCGTPVISRGDDWGSPIEKAHRFNMLPKKTILWLCPDDFEAVHSFLSVYLQKYPHHLHVWGFTPQWLPVFNLSIILGCQLPGTTNKKGSWTFHERGCSWLQYVVFVCIGKANYNNDPWSEDLKCLGTRFYPKQPLR